MEAYLLMSEIVRVQSMAAFLLGTVDGNLIWGMLNVAGISEETA